MRTATVVVFGGVAAFWGLTLAAGALVPGYSARADYVSSLAGAGSEVAVLGLAALLVLPLAHLAAAAVVRAPTVRGPDGRGVAGALVVAAVAGVVVAVFRTPCPAGAAGCGSGANSVPGDLAGTVHGVGVVGYEVAVLGAMALVVVGSARTRPVLATVTALAGVASVLLALRIGGPDLGLWQRGWLVVNTGWLVGLTVAARRGGRPRPGSTVGHPP